MEPIPISSVYGSEFKKGIKYSTRRPGGSGDWLLIYTAGGSGRIVVNKKEIFTRGGDVLLYEPTAAQDYSTNLRARYWNLLWAHFQPRAHWQAWLQWPKIGLFTRMITLEGGERHRFVQAMHRVIVACRRSEPAFRQLAMNALEECILWCEISRVQQEQPGLDPRIRSAIEILTRDLKTPFSLPNLARQCSLSVSRFAHLFHAQTGYTAGKFLEIQRLSHACQLLSLTSLPIKEIASECGYEEPFYFTNRFRNIYKMSPRRFRASKTK